MWLGCADTDVGVGTQVCVDSSNDEARLRRPEGSVLIRESSDAVEARNTLARLDEKAS
jgi:hypothetical protein